MRQANEVRIDGAGNDAAMVLLLVQANEVLAVKG